MSHKIPKNKIPQWKDQALIFAALGNKIRLSLVAKLFDGEPHSIVQLTENTKLTRQAITKHLVILEDAKLVICIREGRESLYKFNPAPMEKIKTYLDQVARQWDDALLRLKSFIEE